GIGASLSLHVQMDNPALTKPCLHIRGKALHRKADKLFSLMRDFSLSPRFDETKRVQELILQLHSAMENRFNKNALKYALQLAMSGFSPPLYVQNSWHGLPYYKACEKLAKEIDTKLPQIIEKL